MSKNEFSEKKINVMLHALGISHSPRNSEHIEPNKRYSPYPTSSRNYYQVSSCEIWDELEKDGYAKFFKGKEEWQDCYRVTDDGKFYLKSLGFKWHN